jgi:hypothetical protein
MGELEVVKRVHINCKIGSLNASEGDNAWQSVKYAAKYVIRCKCTSCKLPKDLLFPEKIEINFTLTCIFRSKGEMRDGTPASKLKVIGEVEKPRGNSGKLGLSFFTTMLSSKDDVKVRLVEQGGHENK